MTPIGPARTLVHRAYKRGWRLRGARRVVHWLGAAAATNPFTCRLWSGASMLVPAEPVGVPVELWEAGVYEQLTSAMIVRYARQRVIYDVGANIGYFTLLACGAGARQVIAFEPFPPSVAWLHRNLEHNGFEQARVLEIALGQEAGELALYEGAEFGPGSVSAVPALSESCVATVPVQPLDEAIRENALPRPDLIKMDIEGFEHRALNGMSALLEQHHPHLVIELNDRMLRQAGSSAAEVVQWLRRIGYTDFYDLDTRRLQPMRPGRTFNALAIAPGSRSSIQPVLESLS